MTRGEFEKLQEKTFEEVRKLSKTKGHDYAGDADALSNFFRIAQITGISPWQVWSVQANKHWDSISTFIREGKLESEPIRERIYDEIAYLICLMGLLEDTVYVAPSKDNNVADNSGHTLPLSRHSVIADYHEFDKLLEAEYGSTDWGPT